MILDPSLRGGRRERRIEGHEDAHCVRVVSALLSLSHTGREGDSREAAGGGVEPCVAPEERVEVPSPIRTPGGWSGSGQARMLRQCTR